VGSGSRASPGLLVRFERTMRRDCILLFIFIPAVYKSSFNSHSRRWVCAAGQRLVPSFASHAIGTQQWCLFPRRVGSITHAHTHTHTHTLRLFRDAISDIMSLGGARGGSGGGLEPLDAGAHSNATPARGIAGPSAAVAVPPPQTPGTRFYLLVVGWMPPRKGEAAARTFNGPSTGAFFALRRSMF
jgi:hypothetical protein